MNFRSQKYPIMWLSFLTESGKMCLCYEWLWSWHFYFFLLGKKISEKPKLWASVKMFSCQVIMQFQASDSPLSLWPFQGMESNWFVLLFFSLSLFSLPGSQVLSLKSGQMSRALLHQERISWMTTYLTDSLLILEILIHIEARLFGHYTLLTKL